MPQTPEIVSLQNTTRENLRIITFEKLKKD